MRSPTRTCKSNKSFLARRNADIRPLLHRLSRQSSISAERLEEYKVLIKNATTDLEDHLNNIDEKLESAFSQAAHESGEDATEIRQMQEERLSTQQGLAICAQLFAQINRLQPILGGDRADRSAGSHAMPPVVAERITREGLDECRDALSNTANRLERHLATIVDRLMARSKAALSSPEDAAELGRLQEEWETARLSLDLCSKASVNVTKVEINVFDKINGGKEVLQFFASTTGRIVHAKDISLGDRGVQYGGQLSDASIQQISRDFGRPSQIAPTNTTLEPVTSAEDKAGSSMFRDRYGPGFKLRPQASQDDPLLSSAGQARQAEQTEQAWQTGRMSNSSISPSL